MAYVGAVAFTARERWRIIKRLRSQNAVSERSAVSLNVTRRSEKRMLARLIRSGVVVEDGGNLYHLDEIHLASANEAIRHRVLVGLAVVFVAAIVAVLLMYRPH